MHFSKVLMSLNENAYYILNVQSTCNLLSEGRHKLKKKKKVVLMHIVV